MYKARKSTDNSGAQVQTTTREHQLKITPDEALEILKAGNLRFMNNLKANRNLLQQVNETSDSQFPFAFILSCIDSRTSAELVFDQGLGDVFSCRIAGNILNDDIIASMEFACGISGAKIVVVLGHTNCGAIYGACNNVQLGKLGGLLDKIRPVVDAARSNGHATSDPDQFTSHVTRLNVLHVMKQVPEQSEVIAKMIKEGEIKLVGGLYDVASGRVEFFEEA